MPFYDIYLTATDRAKLAEFCQNFPNTLGPEQGRAAQPETIGENGETLPARLAAGNPELFYACVRLSDSTVPDYPQDLTRCDPAEACSVLGVWA